MKLLADLVSKNQYPPKQLRKLPCYLKLRRSAVESGKEVEARLDLDDATQIWIRPVDFPYAELEKALNDADLVPKNCVTRGCPVLIVTEDNVRKRALCIKCEGSTMECLDVDSGKVEYRKSTDPVYEVRRNLLSIPSAALRCRLSAKEVQLQEFNKNRLFQWTKTRVKVFKWACVPSVYLGILTDEFSKISNIGLRSITVKTRQRLNRGLASLIVPPLFTLLKSCSIVHLEQPFAYLALNSAGFESEPLAHSSAINCPARENVPSVGDLGIVQLNNISWRIQILEIRGMCAVVQCIDNGSIHTVDVDVLQPLLERHAPLVLRVLLPVDYFETLPIDELWILLRTGVFNALISDSAETPCVRLFTNEGIELPFYRCQ